MEYWFLKNIYLFIIYLFWPCWVLVAACRLLSCGMHAGSSSPTRAQTWAPCTWSTESYPLDHQGSPYKWSIVTEHKFVCPMHNEAKQTKTLGFGAKRGLLQGHARRMGRSCSPLTPNSPKGLSKAFLKASWGSIAPGYVISSCAILWLVDVEVIGQLTLSILRHQKVPGATCSWSSSS